MNRRQWDILKTNQKFLSEKIDPERLVRGTQDLYPDVLKEDDLEKIKTKSGEPRIAYILGRFKLFSDGYERLFHVLKSSGHGDMVLNVLRPCLNIGASSDWAEVRVKGGAEGPNPNQPGSDGNTNKELLSEIRDMMKETLKEEMGKKLDKLASEFSGLKGEIMQKFGAINYRLESLEKTVSSDQVTLENVKTTITKLTDDIKEFKEDYRQFLEKYDQSHKIIGSNEYDLFRKVIDTLSGLDIKDKDIIWREIKQLRTDVDYFKKLSETVWQLSLPQVFITENVRPIAERIKTIWHSVGEKVGVNMTDIEDAKCQIDDEGKAEVVITRWLEKKDNLLTWTDVISVLSEIDLDVARTVTELKLHNP